jgi:hypothetical protein
MSFGFGTANFLQQNLPISNAQMNQAFYDMGGRPGIGGINPGIMTDPTTGRQFTIGAPTAQNLETTQAYQRALAAAGIRDPNLIQNTKDTGIAQSPTAGPYTPVPTGDIVSNLPPLRGTAGGESRIDPTLRPYLGMGLQRAEQLFFGQPPSLYPGQMYVSPSEQTLEALGAQEALARQGQGPLLAGQQAYNQALTGTGFTAGGGFLQGSPFRDMAIESAVRPLLQQFEQTTLPGIQSAFSRAGRYGSGAQTRAIGQATEATGRAIGDISSQIAAADYARERQFQQQALAQQAVLGGLAPQFYQSQFLPAQTLAQVGQARETIAAQPLQEAMQRYQFSQQIPYQQLQGFLSSVYGTPMAQSQFQAQQPAKTNYLGQGIGGALLGSQVGNLFGGIGGLSGAQTGAILGGLGGLLL